MLSTRPLHVPDSARSTGVLSLIVAESAIGDGVSPRQRSYFKQPREELPSGRTIFRLHGGLRWRQRREKTSCWMDLFTLLKTPELRFGDFLIPWGMVIGTLGFLGAWIAVGAMERLGWTRGIWHLPLFFVALAVFLGCVVGLIFTP